MKDKQKMTQNGDILQELVELKSSLANVTPQNTYSVPAGYFDGLAAQVLNRIKAMEALNAVEELGYLSPLLNNISRQMPYAVPAGYFENFSDQVMQLVLENNVFLTPKEELESLSPLLSGLKKEMPYAVPAGYFENLGERTTKHETKPETKIISLINRKWFRYAAAAVFIGIIALAGFVYITNKSAKDQPFARFEKKLNKEIKKTSDKDLDEFIQQFSDAGLNGEEKVYNNPDTEVKELLKDVPETELKEFLEETSDTEITSGEPVLMN
ncbi:MAG: hypothetical protein IPP43_15450 [Chitinophagaceae bacterium]|nr:hypothetical protein [Chitinophagaceae bacterium]MBL0132320.1 hypothetical protein [Chitinophagaceae bacterium]